MTKNLGFYAVIHRVGGVTAGVKAHILAFYTTCFDDLTFVDLDVGFVFTFAETG